MPRKQQEYAARLSFAAEQQGLGVLGWQVPGAAVLGGDTALAVQRGVQVHVQ